MKRIAIPCEGDQLSAHFGHAPQFLFFDVDPQTKQITAEEALTPPPHEPGVLPAWVAQQRATVILAGGMGGRAQQLFAQHGVDVVVGVPSGPARAAVEAYLNGQLTSGENLCDH